MPNNKNEMTNCPECKCPIKKENVSRHILKVHGAEMKDNVRDGGSGTTRAEERKRKKDLRRKKKKKIFLYILLGGIIIMVIYGLGSSMYGNNPNDNKEAVEADTNDQGDITIPISELSDNAKFYKYPMDGVTISYFAVIGSDGEVHVAFDACDVCYRAKLGYEQNGEKMKCINCGKQFNINGIGTENNLEGGCWPSYLPIELEGGNIMIKTEHLEEKAWMF